ncbi:MAG: hypothetical protein J7K26_02195 [Candidatus Aenigmarchaeota archaeon]|nr:hypothetical protein [Candidatus Aenigmarchaeota archaeon]
MTCPECGSHEFVKNMRELICKRCGLVIEDNFLTN